MSETDCTNGVHCRLIPGYDGAYRVGDDGSVWSRYRLGPSVGFGAWKPLVPKFDKGGYCRVGLCLNGNQAYGAIHRLVLKAFVGPCPAGCECRHLNGNPADNRLVHLKWGTRPENSADAVRHRTHPSMGERHQAGKLTETDVPVIRRRLARGDSQSAIARDYGVHRAAIWRIAHNKNWAWLR